MTLEFPFAARNPPQTIPTGHPSTPHEPKLEHHRASARLREAFCLEIAGSTVNMPWCTERTPQPLAPGPAETIFYYYFHNFSLTYYPLPLLFLVDPHAGRPRTSGSADSKGCAHYRRPREKDQGRARVEFRITLGVHSPTRPYKKPCSLRVV